MIEAFPVLGQTAASIEPGEGSFDHPTPWQNHETALLDLIV